MLNTASIPNADYQSRVEYVSGDNDAIIKVIHKNFAVAVKQTKQLAQELYSGDPRKDARRIYNFLRSGIRYTKDPAGQQLIKTPSRLIADKKGDCKSYSLFAGSLLANMGYPVILRYASYDRNPVPSHVYVVTKDQYGNEIILDGVYKAFDQQVPYKFKYDYPMEIRTLSGIDYYDDVETIDGFFKKAWQKVKNVGKKVVNVGKKVGGAPLRNAFLLLVRLNVRSLATNLNKVLGRNPSQLKKVWERFGGNYNALKSTIAKGKLKKRLGQVRTSEDALNESFEAVIDDWMVNARPDYMEDLNQVDIREISGYGIGADPVSAGAVASALALATPIILAVTGMIKSANELEKEKIDQNNHDDLLNTGNDMFVDATGMPPSQYGQQVVSSPDYLPNEPRPSGAGFKLNKNTLLLGGLALAGILVFAGRKRR